MTKAASASVIPLREDIDDPLVAYLLVRTDLPSLGRGKAYAHAMHAGNHLTHDLWVTPLLNEEGRGFQMLLDRFNTTFYVCRRCDLLFRRHL